MNPIKHNQNIINKAVDNFKEYLKQNNAYIVSKDGKVYLKIIYMHSEYPGDSDYTSSLIELVDTAYENSIGQNFEIGEILP